MSQTPDNPKPPAPEPPSMEINLDRPRRVRSLILYTTCVLAIGTLFGWLLMQFTGSALIGFGLAFGMLAYMLLMAKWAGRSLRGPGD